LYAFDPGLSGNSSCDKVKTIIFEENILKAFKQGGDGRTRKMFW